MRFHCRRAASSATMLMLAACAGLAAGPAHAEPPLQVRDLDGRPVQPFASGKRAAVFVFTRTDCPIAARYAPELQRLQRRAAAASIGFWLVFVDPDESPDSIREYLRAYAYEGAALRDPDHVLVQRSGATTTPEAAVFVEGSSGPSLVYRGRIDNRYVELGRARPSATRHDLDEVIDAVRAGRTPALRTTPAVGCLIADVQR